MTIAIAMMGLLAASASPREPFQLVSSNISGTEIRIVSPEPSWESVALRGRTYQGVRLEGATESAFPGEPALPVYRFVVALPPGTRPDIEVVARDRLSYRDIDVPPAGRTVVVPRQRGQGFEPLVITPDPVSVADPYPATRARVIRTGRIRSLDVAYVEVCPFQYYPSQRLLCLDREISVQVKTPTVLPTAPRGPITHDFLAPVLSSLVVNWEAARHWRQGIPEAVPRVTEHWQPPSPAFKLLVNRTAFYSVTGAELQAAGMPIASVAPATLRLLAQDVEVPLRVIGEANGRLDPDDRVEFVGAPVYRDDQGNRLLPAGGEFTETNVYWLTWGGMPGQRMQTRTVDAQSNGVPAPYYRERAHLEQDLNPFVPNEGAISGDRYGTEWFWGPPLTPGDGIVNYGFTLRGVANVSDPVQLRVSLRGYTHPDLNHNPHHHAIVYLNDLQLTHLLWYANDEAFYDSREDPYYDPSLWPNNGALEEGVNHFSVEISGDTEYGWFDGAYTDWFEVDYWRTYRAWNDSLAFWSPQQLGAGTYVYTVSGFADSGQILLDLTHLQILQGFQEVNLGAITGWAVKFRDPTADSTQYLALAAGRRASVLDIVEDIPSDLSGSGGADLVVISSAELIDEAARLAENRAFNGTPVSSMLVDVQDVYDEYRYGVFDPRGIHDFLQDAYLNWSVPPSFVVLFGDASWDYKLNSPTSDPTHRNFVPSFGNPVMDDYFANVDDQGGLDSLLPDLYLARIPVENADTARIVVDKLLGYQNGDWDPGTWRENVFLIAGGYLEPNGNDTRGYFKSQCQTLINQWVLPEPAHYNAILFGRPDSLHFNNEFETTEDESLQYYFNDVGVAHATYIGHGASWTWETMFWVDDVENDLTNTRMLPMVNSMTCHTGRFANPEIDSFGEIWMWQRHGAMGFWGTTGWGHTTPDYHMAKRQFESIFKNQERTPIVALTVAKLAPELAPYMDDPMISPLLYTWFGDPLVPLALAGRPDWVIGSMGVHPDPTVSGDTVSVTINVRNVGIDAGPPTTLRLFDAHPDSGGSVLRELAVPPISVGDSATVTWVTVASGSEGTRQVHAWANPDTTQQEGFRGNNRGAVSYSVLDPIPDLATADSLLTLSPETPEVLDSLVTVRLGIVNEGLGPAGEFSVLFVDSSLTAGVIRELGDRPVAGLARGESTMVEIGWAIVDGDVGDHLVRALVDSRGEVEELDEENNAAAGTLHIASRAELVAEMLMPSNTRPPEGDSLSLTGVWENVGEAATPYYEVAIYHGHPDSAGSYVVGEAGYESTQGGETDSMVVTWDTVGQVGTHVFYLVVDRGETVAELDETDNVRSTGLEVVSGADLYLAGFSLIPALPTEGDSATVSFVVRNGGMIPADSFTVLLALDGITIREWRFDAEGRSSEPLIHSWAWERGASAGDHLVSVVLDALDEVPETNEDNNHHQQAVHVMALADLQVTLIPSSTVLVDGQLLTLVSQIGNLGEASAHTVRLWWHMQTDGAWAPVDSLVVPSLAGGESRSDSTSLVVHPGDFIFRAAVSTPVEEQSLANNEASCSVSVRAKYPPDMVMEAVSLTADTVTVGESATAHVTVGNEGETPPDSAWVELRSLPSDSLVKRVTLPPPPAGGESSANVAWNPPHGMTQWVVRATCVPEDAAAGNDTDTLSVTAVWPAELVAVGGIDVTPIRPLTGDTVTVTVRTHNAGERPAPLYTVALFHGNPAPGQSETAELLATVTPEEGLNPGDSATVVLLWATPDEPGLVELFAWIDAAQLVPERDESNNLLGAHVEILARDFTLDPVLPMPSPAPGLTHFVVTASHDAEVTILIYTVSGRLIEQIGPLQVSPARRQAVPWACRDRDGDRVANGVYLYRVEATSLLTGEKGRYQGKLAVTR